MDSDLTAALRHLGHPNPETALAALRKIRAQTNTGFDLIEAELIRRSLQTGSTWDEIGRALGISGSSAHRKYGHLAPPGRRRTPRRRQKRPDL